MFYDKWSSWNLVITVFGRCWQASTFEIASSETSAATKWLTGEIIDAIRTRERCKSTNDNEQYKIWRKQTKKHQYSEILNENANNPASVWKLFKEIGASKRKDSADIFSLKINDNAFENPKDIANEFNIFFFFFFFCDCSIKNQGTYWDFWFW